MNYTATFVPAANSPTNNFRSFVREGWQHRYRRAESRARVPPHGLNTGTQTNTHTHHHRIHARLVETSLATHEKTALAESSTRLPTLYWGIHIHISASRFFNPPIMRVFFSFSSLLHSLFVLGGLFFLFRFFRLNSFSRFCSKAGWKSFVVVVILRLYSIAAPFPE